MDEPDIATLLTANLDQEKEALKLIKSIAKRLATESAKATASA